MSSQIEWTDETWNPTVGCSRVSPGCDNCYAIRVAARGMQDAHVGLVERAASPGSAAKVLRWDWTGEVRCLPDRLDTPLHWKKPRRVFVDSMSDLFHPQVPLSFIKDVWKTMAACPQHTFQILTKRPRRMQEFIGWEVERARMYHQGNTFAPLAIDADGREHFEPLPNVWLGTSVENQRWANERVPHLCATPAAVRFLSIEPLLGPVSLDPWVHLPQAVKVWGDVHVRTIHTPIGWVIVGGESGPGARPMHPAWVRTLRDQCAHADVPFFFKQWGEYAPWSSVGADLVTPEGELRTTNDISGMTAPEGWAWVRRVGKKAAGRELDGRTWDEFPKVAA